MRNMIRLRKLFPVFGRGTLEFLDRRQPEGARLSPRTGTTRFSASPTCPDRVQPVELDLAPFAGLIPVEMLGYTEFPTIGERPYFLTLGPYGFYWFELQRRDAETARPRPTSSSG